MYSILFTKFVLKFNKLRDVNEEQSLNILFIFVTIEVSKLVISKDIKLVQLQNILYIFETLSVSKFVI